MIDNFSRERFEAALPAVNGAPLWKHLGVCSGEHCYVISVRPGVMIYVRSSLDFSGRCAESGEDSIRAWICSDENGTPLGSKNERWISRVSKWEARLTETLRTLWRVGSALGRRSLHCPACDHRLYALKVKKVGVNTGRFFAGCPNCHYFDAWLTPPVQPKELKSA
ncbi:MAG: hypothetical protein M3N13_02595 [Candidatus Eremiobacteraeota bacterium]|nr:hypothetical protein [Candidatus Eremiobacteraeota bacterium]